MIKYYLAIIFLFIAMLGMFAQSNEQGYELGKAIEDFSLTNVDDTKVSLASLEDVKGYVIVFTCNHCPYSVMYEDRLIELHNKYAPQGFPVVAINPNDPEARPEDSFEKMKVRSAEKQFPFVYLFDEGQKIYPKFGAKKTPHVFLVDSEMKLRYKGAIDDSPRDVTQIEEKFLEKAIDAMIKGEDVNPSSTKAIGCSIKTKS